MHVCVCVRVCMCIVQIRESFIHEIQRRPPPVLVRNKTYWEVKNLSHKNLVLAFFFSLFFLPRLTIPKIQKSSLLSKNPGNQSFIHESSKDKL